MRIDYTAKDASRLTGATVSQIENLVRSGVIRPEHEATRRGDSRLYSLRRLAEIAVAVQLVNYGVPVRKLRLIVDSLRRGWPDLAAADYRDIRPTLVLGLDPIPWTV